MKGKLLLAVALLAMFAASSAMATGVQWNILTDATTTTYTYTFTNTDSGDKLIEFDLYAHLNENQILNWDADNAWSFGDVDSGIPGVTDFYWCANDPAGSDGLAYNHSMSVSLSVNKSLSTELNYTLPGTLGNWSYYTLKYSYSEVVGVPSLPAPTNVVVSTPNAPEPMSLIVLATGLVGLIVRRKK